MRGFKAFLLRGNVVDLAIAVVVGVAFTAVVTGFVKDLVTPLIAALGGEPDFSSLHFTINRSKFLYGDFINVVLAFVIVAAVLYFLVVVPYTKAKERFFPKEAEGKPADIALLEEIRDLLATRNGAA